MKTAILIHGSFGHPEENWFPWLKKKLEDIEYQVLVPKFPSPPDQSLDNWMKVFEEYKEHINSETIFIGHSLGPAFIMNVLETMDNGDEKVKTCFFVSGFTGLINNPEFDKVNKTFTDKKFDFDKIKKRCEKFYVIHSDNDPYVPKEKAQTLAKNLGVEVIWIKNGGHINESAGYTKFEELLEILKKS
ncbi:serine hydrolase family protein [Candidatus Pacearchaeota archaeon]|nr:serine hydrolase family protein [Candidatus Pacearchaeota archaeon]